MSIFCIYTILLAEERTHSSDDLMKMSRGILARIDEGIQTLDGKLGARESKKRACRRQQP